MNTTQAPIPVVSYVPTAKAGYQFPAFLKPNASRSTLLREK